MLFSHKTTYLVCANKFANEIKVQGLPIKPRKKTDVLKILVLPPIFPAATCTIQKKTDLSSNISMEQQLENLRIHNQYLVLQLNKVLIENQQMKAVLLNRSSQLNRRHISGNSQFQEKYNRPTVSKTPKYNRPTVSKTPKKTMQLMD